MSWSLHSPLSLIVKLESYILPIYLSLGVVFCCFGLLHKKNILTNIYSTSFRSKRFLFRWYTNLDWMKFQSRLQNYKKVKVIHQKEESGVLTPTFKQTKLRQWLFWIVLDHPDFHCSRLLSYHCSSNSPGSSCQDLSFHISFLVLGTY